MKQRRPLLGYTSGTLIGTLKTEKRLRRAGTLSGLLPDLLARKICFETYILPLYSRRSEAMDIGLVIRVTVV